MAGMVRFGEARCGLARRGLSGYGRHGPETTNEKKNRKEQLSAMKEKLPMEGAKRADEDALPPIFEKAQQLIVLRDEKKRLEERLGKVEDTIEEVNRDLTDEMVAKETPNFTHAGMMFYLVTKTRASAKGGVKQELCDALKGNGYGDLVYETVNHNSLSSFVKEQREENGDMLPEWLEGLVNVFDDTCVQVRRAAKK
jgi:hypothetical protein